MSSKLKDALELGQCVFLIVQEFISRSEPGSPARFTFHGEAAKWASYLDHIPKLNLS